jgi:hypothetical protein
MPIFMTRGSYSCPKPLHILAVQIIAKIICLVPTVRRGHPEPQCRKMAHLSRLDRNSPCIRFKMALNCRLRDEMASSLSCSSALNTPAEMADDTMLETLISSLATSIAEQASCILLSSAEVSSYRCIAKRPTEFKSQS